MLTSDIIQTEEAYQLTTYNKYPIALERGEGCYVWDTDGNKYLDFYGGHCVTALGHCPPRVVQAIHEQADKMLFYSNVVYSPVRANAARLLASVAPAHFDKIFFCNSGTEANETALKLARTFTGKSTVLSMESGFHGRTIGSLSATGIDKYRNPYHNILPNAHFVPFGDIAEVERALTSDGDIAAIILEPIQSMAGVIEADVAYYQSLRTLCDAHNVLLIFDEVQTGVGRTGTFSISEHYSILPDIITMAKSLGSGLPVGATFVSDRIAASVKAGDHGTTFGGGMVPMAAVTATVETILEDNLMDRAGEIFDAIKTGLGPHVSSVSGRGCLIGVTCEEPVKPLITSLREAGVLVGSSMHPNTIRLMPPLNTPDSCIETFLETFQATLKTLAVA